MLWKSVLSTPGAKYSTLDISKFYLGTPMDRPEYMRIPFKIIPQEIIDKYQLNDIEEKGWVYIKIVKGMYGLPQAGKTAHKLLKRDWPMQDTTQHNSPQDYGSMYGDPSPSPW